jgi:hypothetical protein
LALGTTRLMDRILTHLAQSPRNDAPVSARQQPLEDDATIAVLAVA